MKLAQLQKVISDALIDEHQTEALAKLVVSDKDFAAEQRLAIYRDSKLSSLHSAMALTYPVIEKLVGEQFFFAMVDEYIAQTPSQSPTLDDYGDSFVDFIVGFGPAQSLPYLGDVARLEWQWQTAWHGPTYFPLDVVALQQLTEQQSQRLIFELPSNAQLLASTFPVDKIWQSNQANFSGNQHINLDDDPVKLIIWRPNHEVMIERLTDLQWLLLQSFKNRLHLEEVVTDAQAAAELANLTQRGWLAGFTVKPSEEG